MLRALFGATTFGDAVVGGAGAGGVGDAFLSGYRAALRRLVPDLPPDRAVCLCATEEGGAHPRAIQATLAKTEGGWRLDGRKKWVTGAAQADLLLVIASEGADEQGRNRLRLARVEAHQAGVTLQPMPPTAFVPEISHAQVSFEGVVVRELLDGDGYTRYLKPFRTIEDAHVVGAVLAYLVSRGPRPFAEKILAVLSALEKVACGDPSSRELHLVLAGALVLGRQLTDEAASHLPEPARGLWIRDAALLNVAQKARQARTDSAWSSLAAFFTAESTENAETD